MQMLGYTLCMFAACKDKPYKSQGVFHLFSTTKANINNQEKRNDHVAIISGGLMHYLTKGMEEKGPIGMFLSSMHLYTQKSFKVCLSISRVFSAMVPETELTIKVSLATRQNIYDIEIQIFAGGQSAGIPITQCLEIKHCTTPPN